MKHPASRPNRVIAALGFTLAVVGAACSIAVAAPPPAKEWISHYAGPAGFFNNAQGIAVDPSGNVYSIATSATGTGSAMALVKYSPDGQSQWVSRYLGKPTGSDKPFVVLVGPDGDVVMAGVSDGTLGPGGNSFGDYLIARYDAQTGDELWVRRIDGAGNNLDGLLAAVMDSSGNIVGTGQSWSGTDYDWLTVKVDYATGAVLWTAALDGVAGGDDGVNDAAVAITIDAEDNTYVAGWVQVGYDYGEEFNLYAYGVARYSPLGDLDWFTVIGDEFETGQPSAIAIDGSGNVVVTGSKYPDGTHALDPATGIQVWWNEYQGPAGTGAFPYAMRVAPDGDVVLAGSTCLGTSFCDESHAAWKLSGTSGALSWASVYTAPEANRAGGSARGLAIDDEGNVYTTGFYIFFSGTQQAVTRSLDADGTVRWTDRILGTAPDGADPAAGNSAAAIDPTTGALVTAGTQGKAAKSFLTTIKYRLCAADFDGSGFVDTDDFTAFVLAFEAGTDDADFDRSGFVDTDDYDAFVHSFEAGC